MPTEVDYAWAAGFLDGEGCWYAIKGKPRRNGSQPTRFGLSVNQADPRPLERLAAIAGHGLVKGPYVPKERKVTRNHPVWYFVISGDRAWAFYLQLEPYMAEPKKEQVQRVWDKLTRKPVADSMAIDA